MPLYISGQTLRESVDRLSVSAAQSSLADYLIFKRALVLARATARDANAPEPESVVTGTRSDTFVEAVEEFSLRIPPGSADPEDTQSPYYVPFGSRRDRTLGYRTKKYPSNGPSDTASRWQSRSGRPLALVPETSPKEFRFVERTSDDLEDFFMVRSAAEHFSGEKPGLLDVAVWWFRFTDLEPRFGDEPGNAEMIDGLIGDLELIQAEVSAFFTLDEEARAGEAIGAADKAVELESEESL